MIKLIELSNRKKFLLIQLCIMEIFLYLSIWIIEFIYIAFIIAVVILIIVIYYLITDYRLQKAIDLFYSLPRDLIESILKNIFSFTFKKTMDKINERVNRDISINLELAHYNGYENELKYLELFYYSDYENELKFQERLIRYSINQKQQIFNRSL